MAVRTAAPSNIESDRPHELDAVALGNDAGMQLEVKTQLAVAKLVLKVNVLQGACLESGNVGERQVMSADEADRSPFDQCTNDAVRSDEPVGGVRSLQELIQEKQQRQRRRFEKASQPGDLGVEARAALMQRIIDADAGADAQRRELQAFRPHRSS